MNTATRFRCTETDQKPTSGSSDTELVQAALAGSAEAWSHLVDRYDRLVWHVIRSFRFSRAAAEDVSQSVWLSALEKLDQLRDFERIGAWLATTARNTAIAEWRRTQRQIPVGSDFAGFDSPYVAPDRVVEGEEVIALVEAYERLSESDRQLLRLTVAEPHLAYEDIAELVGRPVGSIGPSRARTLNRLRREFGTLMGEPVFVKAA